MFRRIVLVAAATFALLLVPSVAMAYTAPGYGSTVSDSTPQVGSRVTVWVQGGSHERMKLVVRSKAGVRTLTATTNTHGRVTFTFTAGPAGTTTLQVYNAAGKLVSDQTLAVHRPDARDHEHGHGHGHGDGHGNQNGDGDGHGHGHAAPVVASSHHGFDGVDGKRIALGGGVLLLPGAGVAVFARRRRSAKLPS